MTRALCPALQVELSKMTLSKLEPRLTQVELSLVRGAVPLCLLMSTWDPQAEWLIGDLLIDDDG